MGDPISKEPLEKDPGVRRPSSPIKFGWYWVQSSVLSDRRMCNLLLEFLRGMCRWLMHLSLTQLGMTLIGCKTGNKGLSFPSREMGPESPSFGAGSEVR